MSSRRNAVRLVRNLATHAWTRLRIGRRRPGARVAELRFTTSLSGRTFFLLPQLLSHAGYQVRIAPSLRFLGKLSNDVGRQILRRRHLLLGRPTSDATLIVSDDPSDPQADVVLDYDYLSWILHRGPAPDDATAVGLATGFDPLFLDRPGLFGPRAIGAEARRTRVAFSGRSRPGGYDHRRQFDCFDVVPRHRALHVLGGAFEDAARPESGGELLRDFRDPARRIVLGGHSAKVRRAEWPRTLADVEFYLALPGSYMPFSQNLIEAMAVGSIPILEYGALMDPPLVDGEHCLAYRGEQGLVEAVERALQMSPDVVRAMRGRVVQYYTRNLSPEGFAARLDAAVRLARTRGGKARLFMNLGYTSVLLFTRAEPEAVLPLHLLDHSTSRQP